MAGIATYVLAGELALGRVLAGDLPRPAFPPNLRETAPDAWFRLAAGAMSFADVYAGRQDRVACLANLCQAVLAAAQGRLAAAGEWVLNEKAARQTGRTERHPGSARATRAGSESACLRDPGLPGAEGRRLDRRVARSSSVRAASGMSRPHQRPFQGDPGVVGRLRSAPRPLGTTRLMPNEAAFLAPATQPAPAATDAGIG